MSVEPQPRPRLPAPSWARTRALIRSDFARVLAEVGNPRSFIKRAFWFVQPTYLCLFLYRLYHHLHRHGWRNTSLLLYTLSVYVTRVEIPPVTVIGEACLLGHAPMVLCGRIGDRFTLWGDGGTGGGLSGDDIGGGPGLPVVGDDVVMAIRASVLGPVRIGDGARLGPGSMVMRDVPPGAVVAAPLSRIMPAPEAPASQAQRAGGGT